MDLSGTLRYLRRVVLGPKVEDRKEITPPRPLYETYLKVTYRVLSWEDATLTMSVFLALNFLFWLAAQLELRFFGVVFLSALFYIIADLFGVDSNIMRDDEDCDLEGYEDFRSSCMNVYMSLKSIRKDSPSSFCFCVCFLLFILSFFAKDVSGYTLFYLTLLAVFFTPLGIQNAPPEHAATIKRFLHSIGSDKGVLAEDELIPFITATDLSERDPDQDSLLTDRTADSVTNSLISGISQMPSHLDVADGQELLEEDLMLSRDGSPNVRTPGELSSDSDSDHHAMRFESKHFNGDSSSEDEKFTKNLNFSKMTGLPETTPAPAAVEGMMSSIMNVASASGAMVANVLKTAVSSVPNPPKESDSDSEFEIVEADFADES